MEKEPKKTDWVFNGGCCLVKNADYKGYCNLCMVYHSNGSEHFGEGYTIEFTPLYNEEGQMILVEYDKEESFAVVICGYEVYGETEMKDATITFWKYGTFTEFNK